MVSPDSDDKPNSPRKAISRRLRFEILRRDDHACRYCGVRVPDVVLTIDHVVPVALGGTDDPSNLVAACKDCNAGKTSSSPDASLVAQATEDALRWSAAMQVAAGLALDEVEKANTYISDVDAAWLKWGDGVIPRPSDWGRTVRHWYSAGLPAALVVDAIELAMTNRQVEHHSVWRYACGIAWKRLAQIGENASRMLAEGDA